MLTILSNELLGEGVVMIRPCYCVHYYTITLNYMGSTAWGMKYILVILPKD